MKQSPSDYKKSLSTDKTIEASDEEDETECEKERKRGVFDKEASRDQTVPSTTRSYRVVQSTTRSYRVNLTQ